ncbi:Ref family recombination enhancement nuclease [Kluyvera sp. CHPC 1.2972]|uniref:Ref family recombination enhancement nuclease n=1 Tax=Kluyvera sp. CHPC 1.2972 TaxID=2995176 RepID=UPI002FD7FC88
MKKAEREHVNKVAELGCVACYVQAGVWGTPGEIHHIREGQGMAQRAGWKQVICLCTNHHRNSGNGKLAIHAGKLSFTNAYGTESELLDLTLNSI